jgi:hypothetical protein
MGLHGLLQGYLYFTLLYFTPLRDVWTQLKTIIWTKYMTVLTFFVDGIKHLASRMRRNVL